MRILGVNGGNGVLLYPMRRHLIANFEPRSIFKTPDDIQWKLNFKVPVFNNPLALYSTHNKDYLKELDIIVSAPDCGHSSILAYSRAKKLSNPKLNHSFNYFIRSIIMGKPKIFMMENLAKILDIYTEDEFIETFPDYYLIFHSDSVSEWGNSQKNRKRLIMIGLRKTWFGMDLSKIQYHFSNVYKVNELLTCAELIGDLVGIEDIEFGHVREDISDIITLYSGKKLTLEKIRKFWLDNPKLKRWPVIDKNFTTAPGVYRNLANSYPAVARKANRQYNQEGLQLTPRELARIQGIPDRFKLYMDKDRLGFCINKARATVTKSPPYEIGRWFYAQLKQIKDYL